MAYDIKVHFLICKYNSLLGCPSIIRSDYGTENSVLAACHMALRHNHDDEISGARSFRFGSSTTNTVEFICAYTYST